MTWLTFGVVSSVRAGLPAFVLLSILLAALAPASGQPSAAPPRTTAPASEKAPNEQEPGRNVLLLYTEPRLTPSIVSADRAMRSTLEARSPVPIYFYTEFLDLNLF